VFAAIQSRTPPERRAVAASINLFVANIIGLGAGPSYVGLISDRIGPAVGDQALPFALATLGVFYLVAAALFALAARLIQREVRSLAQDGQVK
jgi:uncharacterized membrane protein YvlD (DUF360 family)